MLCLICVFAGLAIAELTPCPDKNVYSQTGYKHATFVFSYDSDLKILRGDLTCEGFWRVAKDIEISAEACPSTLDAIRKLDNYLVRYAYAVCLQDFVYYQKVLPYVQVGPNGSPLLWTRYKNNEWSVNEMKGDDFRSLAGDLNLFVQIRVGKWGVNYGENVRILLLRFLLVIGEFIAPPTVGARYSSLDCDYENSHMSQPCKSLTFQARTNFTSWYSKDSRTVNGYIKCIDGTEVGRDGPNPLGYTNQFIQFTNQDGCAVMASDIVVQQLKHLAKTWCPSFNPDIHLPVNLVAWKVKVYEFKHETPKGLVGFPVDSRVRDSLKFASQLVRYSDLYGFISPKFYLAQADRFHEGNQVLVRVQRMLRDLQRDCNVSKKDFINSMAATSALSRNVENTLSVFGGTLKVKFSSDGDFALVPLLETRLYRDNSPASRHA